jgi:hypothetical protein
LESYSGSDGEGNRRIIISKKLKNNDFCSLKCTPVLTGWSLQHEERKKWGDARRGILLTLKSRYVRKLVALFIWLSKTKIRRYYD